MEPWVRYISGGVAISGKGEGEGVAPFLKNGKKTNFRFVAVEVYIFGLTTRTSVKTGKLS